MRLFAFSALAIANAITLSPIAHAADVSGIAKNGNQPLDNAQIRIPALKLNTRTDSSGHFRLDIPDGNYTIEIIAADGRHWHQMLHVGGGELAFDVAEWDAERIVVTASALRHSTLQMATPVIVLSGDELTEKQQAPLGETLSGEVGINASQFGAGASRPVIRGLGGDRVKVLADGVDVLDASNVSADHYVTSEPLLAEQIEIIKGPATLLYGSGSIGGVVNIVDSRVPRHVPEDGLEGGIELRANTVADERTAVIKMNAGANQFAWHLDAIKRESNDYEIPGEAEAFHDDADSDEDEHEGVLANTFNDTQSATLGASYITDKSYIGVSITRNDNRYGIPGHTEHADEEPPANEEHEAAPYIDLEQTRVDVRGEWLDPFAGIEATKLRIGHSDYTHQEIEGGEVGTTFNNDAIEARVEVLHQTIGQWRGAVGTQVMQRDFSALGEEAYTPATRTRNIGLFVMEETQRGNWHYELGARVETQSIDVTDDDRDAHHRSLSASAGALWQFKPSYSLGLAYTRAERLPVAEELFANGPHAASGTFEVGNPDLDSEVANNIDVTVRRFDGNWQWTFNVFRNQIDGFIYAADTGNTVDDLREVVYRQHDAEFTGVEAEIEYQLNEEWQWTVFADSVRGELRGDGGDLPRIPPRRLGSRLIWLRSDWSARLEWVNVANQDRIAEFETESDGYQLLNASISYRWLGDKTDALIFVRGNNLRDDEIRSHSSFIKDVAPQPGRNFTVGIRFGF